MAASSEDLSARAHQLLGEPIKGDLLERAITLSIVGVQLFGRFRRFGRIDDLEVATEVLRRVVEITPDAHPDKITSLTRLSSTLMSRFEYLGTLSNLEESIALLRRSVELSPDDSPEKPHALDKLSRALEGRFARVGEPSDLEQATHVRRRAVELSSENDSALAGRLDELGNSLDRLYKCHGKLDDFSQSISAKRRAVDLTPDDHPDKFFRLISLGSALQKRFDLSGAQHDLADAHLVFKHATELLAGAEVDESIQYKDLGTSLYAQYERTGNPGDLAIAIFMLARAEETIPDSHPDKSVLLDKYARALLAQSDSILSKDDLERAIAALRLATELTAAHHPDRSVRLHSLATALRRRLEWTLSRANFDAAIACFTEATAAPGMSRRRLDGVTSSARLHADFPAFSSPKSLAQVYGPVFDILEENLVWVWLSAVPEEKEFIEELQDQIRAAVAASISAGALSQAVERLEAGRALFHPQVLSLRGTLDALSASQPDFAAAFKEILGNLLQPSRPPRLSEQHEAHPRARDDHHRSLLIQFESMLRDIRHISGFENTLRPMKFQDIVMLSERLSGFVVYLNLHSSHCDALILASGGGVTLVNLPELTVERARRLRLLWLATLRMSQESAHDSQTLGLTTLRDRQLQSAFNVILQRLWTWVVRPVLQDLKLMDAAYNDRLPHIIWITTGALVDIPLHAAGIYDDSLPKRGPRVFDFVVSSYLPTLAAVQHRKDKIRGQGVESAPKLLYVAHSVQGSDLLIDGGVLKDHTDDFLEARGSTILVNELATVNATISAIGQSSWLHLACPSFYDRFDLTQSVFTLFDGALPLTVLVDALPDNAEFAFLSDMQGTGTSDASMRMAEGMLAVGYADVVASMWSTGPSKDASAIASTFYKSALSIRRGETGISLEDEKSAHVLHRSVQRLREEVGESSIARWAPFVHLGI